MLLHMFYGNWQFYPSAIVLYDDQRWKSCLFYICIFDHLGTKPNKLYCYFKNSKNKVTGIVVALTIPLLLHLYLVLEMTMVVPLVPLLFILFIECST